MNTIAPFEAGGCHREVGLAIGFHFAGAIHRFFDSYERLQRAATLCRKTPPVEAGHVLELPGNRTDFDYPIY